MPINASSIFPFDLYISFSLENEKKNNIFLDVNEKISGAKQVKNWWTFSL